MPSRDNSQFELLQSSKFTALTAYSMTGDRVVYGSRQEFQKVIDHVYTESAQFNTDSPAPDRQIFDTASSLFKVQPAFEGIALYSQLEVAKLYPTLSPSLLPTLINAHLHEHFIRTHSVLTVLDPVDNSRLDPFHQRASVMAKSIAACPVSPLPGSCPPNLPRCKPCKPGTIVRSRSLEKISQSSFLIAMVPHPYTYLSYVHQKSNLDSPFVRGTRRDDWVQSVTSG